jgi:hypothetical protein
MNPYQLARQVYDREPCARSFEEDLFWHLQYGIVLSTPAGFAMIRSVWSHWSKDRLKSPRFVAKHGDCWMIWLAAGDITSVWALGPRKDWVCFERRNLLRVWPYDTVRRLYRSRPQPAAVPA